MHYNVDKHRLRMPSKESLHCKAESSLPLPNFQVRLFVSHNCHISPIFQISLIYAFIGCSQSMAVTYQSIDQYNINYMLQTDSIILKLTSNLSNIVDSSKTLALVHSFSSWLVWAEIKHTYSECCSAQTTPNPCSFALKLTS